MKQVTVFAMTRKGLEVLRALVAVEPGLVAGVIAARDRDVADDGFEALSGFCRGHAIAFAERGAAAPPAADYSLAVSWRWLIPAGPARPIVLHDSLLPRNRGFNPLVTALINGDREIGVTALYATGEYDRGDVIAQSASPIEYPITIGAAIEAVLKDYRVVATRIAEHLRRGEAPPARPQDEAGASYSLWRDEQDYFIDWSQPAGRIRRFVDAVGSPYRGAAARVDGAVVRVLRAEALPDVAIENRTPGKVVFVHDGRPVVVCGEGLLRIDELVDAAGGSLLPLARFRTRFGA